jgi:hypothetical protein
MAPNKNARIELKLIQAPKKLFGLTYGYTKACIEVSAIITQGNVEHVSVKRFSDINAIDYHSKEVTKSVLKYYKESK